ncbi:Hypothetical predicted protein, partial [Pelobates cultripes]
VVDEWQAAASDQEESDWDSAAKSDPYLIGEQTLGEPQDSVATTMDNPQEGSEIFLDNSGLRMFDPRNIRHPRSEEWMPPEHMTRFMHFWLQKSLDKE